MGHRFPSLAPTLLGKLRRLRRRLSAHRFWVLTFLSTTGVLLAALISGASSLQRVESLRREEAALHDAALRIARWHGEVQPEAEEEAGRWAQSDGLVRALATGVTEPIAVIARLGARAERIGIEDIFLSLAAVDSSEAVVPRRAGEWELTARTPPLHLEFIAPITTFGDFLDELPPYLEVRAARVERVDAQRVRVALTILIREVTGI